jgi:AcrR family transcriptional regulator
MLGPWAVVSLCDPLSARSGSEALGASFTHGGQVMSAPAKERARSPRTLRDEHSEATRMALVKSARSLFGSRGYPAVSLDEVAAKARVTKGALYHHFDNKKDLFRAVCDQIEHELGQKALESGMQEMDLLAGFYAFLDAFADPKVQQIVMRDSPAVLSWEEHRAIQAEHGLGAITTGLEAAMAAGQIDAQPVEPLAKLFLATLCEGAAVIANAPDPGKARRQVRSALKRLVSGLSS